MRVLVEMTVLVAHTHAYITLSQKDRRHFEENSNDYIYNISRFIVAEGTPNYIKRSLGGKFRK